MICVYGKTKGFLLIIQGKTVNVVLTCAWWSIARGNGTISLSNALEILHMEKEIQTDKMWRKTSCVT